MPAGTFYQVLASPTTKIAAKAFQTVLLTECEDWRQAIIDALNNISNPEDEANATIMVARARSYTMIEGTLYKKGIVQPLLKCISQSEARNSYKKYTQKSMDLNRAKGTIGEGNQARVLLAHAH
jgi:hypothetical protein